MDLEDINALKSVSTDGNLTENADVIKLLLSIKNDTGNHTQALSNLDTRVELLENSGNGVEIAKLKETVTELIECNRTLTGRLIRMEKKVSRQGNEICDLKCRSMRDNIIIKTKGDIYKEKRQENTEVLFKTFVEKEMRVADAANISIDRAHRMGPSGGEFNRMMIAKVPSNEDHRRIFMNAKSLKNTNFSISRQFPSEIEERRQFGWPEYKTARSSEVPARFDGGKLLVNNTHIKKFDPMPLPPLSSSTQGHRAPLIIAESEMKDVDGHTFQAWAVPVNCLTAVRDAHDMIVQDHTAAASSHLAFGYRLTDAENFESDSDHGAGLHIVKTLRTKNMTNIALFVAHNVSESYCSMKLKLDTIRHVCCEALMALDVSVNGGARRNVDSHDVAVTPEKMNGDPPTP